MKEQQLTLDTINRLSATLERAEPLTLYTWDGDPAYKDTLDAVFDVTLSPDDLGEARELLEKLNEFMEQSSNVLRKQAEQRLKEHNKLKRK